MIILAAAFGALFARILYLNDKAIFDKIDKEQQS